MLLEKPPAHSERGKVLIDGDIVVYRAALAPTSVSELDVMLKVDEVLRWIILNTQSDSELDYYQVYLSGKGNFRNELAVTHPYKGNRKDKEEPRFKKFCRQYILDKYEAILSSNEEADDLLSKDATSLGPNTIIASIDKDLLQVPCYHYNFKNDVWHQVSEFEGLMAFYQQILTGDNSDNIVGLHGIGPAKSKKILVGCETEEELWEKVLEAYDGNEERVVENARLLWLRRVDEELWVPPHSREELGQSKQVTDQA